MHKNYNIHKSAGIIIKERKLLIERSVGKDFFISPGGSIERGETPKVALVRELMEEFTIRVLTSELKEFGVFYAEAVNNPGNVVRMEVFFVNHWEGEIIPSGEVEEIFWVTSNIPQKLKIGTIFAHDVIPKLKNMELID